MLDHMKLNQENYYPSTKIANNYIDCKLIGKQITYSNYKVGWTSVEGGSVYVVEVRVKDLSWNPPSEVGGIQPTGEIFSIAFDPDTKEPLYGVVFEHWIDNPGTGDGVYRTFIRASEINSRYLKGQQL